MVESSSPESLVVDATISRLSREKEAG